MRIAKTPRESFTRCSWVRSSRPLPALFCHVVRLPRQLNPERGPLAEGTLHIDRAAVLRNDATRHEQAEAGSLAARLGGVEGLEDPLERIRGDARAGILDPDLDAI